MKTAVLILLILPAIIVLSSAAPAPEPQYPNSIGATHYQPPAPQGGYSGEGGYGSPTTTEEPPLTVFKHVYIHVAPDDQASGAVRKIKAPGGGEKHVKIIFVKAPAPAAADRQVVEIPQAGEQKTLVYVLLKKADATPDVGISPPPPTKPSKPEVYFIRYKDQQKSVPEYGVPSPSSPAQYGVPA